MTVLKYVKGDVTAQKFTQNTILLHGCNNCYPIPVMGSGIAGIIAKKWPKVYDEYKAWMKDGYTASRGVWISHPRLRLGEVQMVLVSGSFKDNTAFAVVNLISQQDTGVNDWGMQPVRYQSIEEGLYKLSLFITNKLNKKYKQTQIVSVKLGCGLGGGDWNQVKSLFDKTLCQQNILTTIYYL